MSGGQTPTHWIAGRLHDNEPTPTTPWQQIISVLVLLWLFDFALGRRAETEDPAKLDRNTAQLREVLVQANAEAEAGHRAILMIGDSVLAGDVLANSRPDDWDSQRVIDHMRRELGRNDDALIEQVALDGLLPVDALHLVAELDRLDPGGEVELVVELNLRYFSSQYADQRDCTRSDICDLGDAQLDHRLPVLAWDGVATAAVRVRDQLLEWTPVYRRRGRVAVRPLDQVPGLAVARRGKPSEEANDYVEPDPDAPPDQDVAEARARVREHYRSASIDPTKPSRHAQVEALVALLDRAIARERKLTLFVTPLEDTFARRSFEQDDEGGLGHRYAALARLVNDYQDPGVQLIDLDHPLFVDAHFIDHVHLGVEGSRLLALNLLHELNLPLEQRPFEQQMVHPEGHDRTLVHRVDTGYAEGGAWDALFDRPEGVAVSRDGSRIIVADTYNQVLRELRGNMQFVETVAGRADKFGRVDGPGLEARLNRPRSPELLGDAVWFIDGKRRDAIRVFDQGYVRTPAITGPSCAAYRSIRARPGADDRPPAIWALCDDSRLLHVDVVRREATVVSEPAPADLVAFDLSADTVYLADVDGRLWQRELSYEDGEPQLGDWDKVFANTATELLPHGNRDGYPYAYDELRLAKVVELRYVERYGGLLVADEFPLTKSSKRLARELTERVQLRYFDLDAERILPWVKAVPHGEAHALYNKVVEQVVSYWHLGAMAIAQDDASLVWVERRRSRLLCVADGLLGVAKTGNHHTPRVTVPMPQTLAGVSRTVEAELRPDRFLASRREPLSREGPYVAVLFGSSLSAMSDRLSNYSLGRRLELELQRELGYRDLIRLDLFQVTDAAPSLRETVDTFDEWLSSSVAPDLVLIEVGPDMAQRGRSHDVEAQLARLGELARQSDSLVVLYDLSSMDSNTRDGMRATDEQTLELLERARQQGFVVLDPGDRLFAELLRHSPWGNQTFASGRRHGAPWSVDLSARALAATLGPTLREFLRGRVAAHSRELPSG